MSVKKDDGLNKEFVSDNSANNQHESSESSESSGRYSAMGVSQKLAAPTYPKINEYTKMKARESEREASDTRTN